MRIRRWGSYTHRPEATREQILRDIETLEALMGVIGREPGPFKLAWSYVPARTTTAFFLPQNERH